MGATGEEWLLDIGAPPVAGCEAYDSGGTRGREGSGDTYDVSGMSPLLGLLAETPR